MVKSTFDGPVLTGRERDGTIGTLIAFQQVTINASDPTRQMYFPRGAILLDARVYYRVPNTGNGTITVGRTTAGSQYWSFPVNSAAGVFYQPFAVSAAGLIGGVVDPGGKVEVGGTFAGNFDAVVGITYIQP